jgi:hypothetical protein
VCLNALPPNERRESSRSHTFVFEFYLSPTANKTTGRFGSLAVDSLGKLSEAVCDLILTFTIDLADWMVPRDLLIDGSAQGGACIFGEDNNIVGDRL